MNRIFVLYTGGTIGMVAGQNGLQPDTALAQTALAPFAGACVFDWHVCNPLIDSSAVTPQHWAEWLALLQQKIADYDGVLVLHGTDTLAYTANLLALTLDTLGKPVLITGSQKPFGSADSDAPRNLQTAVTALQNPALQGVCIAFNGSLLPAVGSSKCSTESDAGFANAHFGEYTDGQGVNALPSRCRFDASVHVVPVFLVPGTALAHAVHTFDKRVADAVILQSYGHGNAPADAAFCQAVECFTASGGVVLNISQCFQGCAAAVYAQGDALRRSGVINAGKCNIETATVLAMLACANEWTGAETETVLQQLKLLA